MPRASAASFPQSREPQAPAPSSPAPQAQASNDSQPPATAFDKSIFQKPIPGDQLDFLNHFAGAPSGDAIRDKQYRKLMHDVLPNVMFHYGSDMPLSDAIDKVLAGSPLPVQIRDGRYVLVSGRSGPYLAGRGFIWIDMQDGLALGGFYFHPTNGEPTPTVTIFSKQIKEASLKMSQLPSAFADDLAQFSGAAGIPQITTRYFITARKEKILLEHDEDYCAPVAGAAVPSTQDCEQLNANAADIDLEAAYYLEQTHHATNGTAWMITGQDQAAWIIVRDQTCGPGPNQLRCRIRVTRERTHVIINRRPSQTPRGM
jgi:uncharacterized protein YecT (DUF1311 family)